MKHPFRITGAILTALCLSLAGQARAGETTPPTAVDLLSCANYLVLTGAGIQDLTSSVVFIGNIGTSPIACSAITGITDARVTGDIVCVDASGPAGSVVDPATLTTAKGDLTTAYNDTMGRVLARITQAPELGGLTLAPGLYWSATGFNISTGDLTLDPGVIPNAVWIFMAGTAGSPEDLVVGTTRSVILANGALASNVFWGCRSASLGTSTTFRGIILADQSITNAGGGLFEGRQLAFTGSATFNGAAFPGVGIPGSFAPPTPTSTQSTTPSHTPTASLTPTQSQTPSFSPTASLTPTQSLTPSASPTVSPTQTETPVVSATSTRTQTPVLVATLTPTQGTAPPVNTGSYIYPSPSTGDTARIVYTMTSAGSVRIRIYNEVGRLVDKIEEDKPAGWQGSIVSVGRFATGTYYYVLTQIYPGGTETQSSQKFAVLR